MVIQLAVAGVVLDSLALSKERVTIASHLCTIHMTFSIGEHTYLQLVLHSPLIVYLFHNICTVLEYTLICNLSSTLLSLVIYLFHNICTILEYHTHLQLIIHSPLVGHLLHRICTILEYVEAQLGFEL